MKKFRFFSLMIAALGLGFGFTSCEEDIIGEDGEAVTINVNASADKTEVAVGDTITVTYDVLISDNKLETIQFLEGEEVLQSVEEFEENTRHSGEFTYEATEAGDFTLTVMVEDNKGNPKSSSLDVTVVSVGEITTYEAVLMGAQKNNDYGSFLDVNTGTVHTVGQANDNQADVDIVYYFGIVNKASFAAPDNQWVNGDGGSSALTWTQDWSTQNSTKFKATSLSTTDFDAIQDDVTIKSEATNLSASDAKEVAVDNVIAFETVDGKKGLFVVKEIDGEADGTITIEVKVQK